MTNKHQTPVHPKPSAPATASPYPAPAALNPADFDREKAIYPPFIDLIGDGKTPYQQGSKTCARCRAGTSNPSTLFWKSLHWSSRPPVGDGFCNVCVNCAVEILGLTADGLKEKDCSDWEKVCELLDMPLNTKKIGRILDRDEIWESDDPAAIVMAYTKPESRLQVRGEGKVTTIDFVEKTETEEEKLMGEEEQRVLIGKWGKKDKLDLLKLEHMWNEMLDTYEVKTPSQRDYIKKICNVSLELDKLLEMGDMDGVTKLTRTYDLLMKSAKLTEAQRNDTNSISSISELSAIVESQGFIPQWEDSYSTGTQDLVDRTIADMQKYTERLIRECVDIDTLFKRYADSVIQEDDRKEKEIVLDEGDDIEVLENDILQDVNRMERDILSEVEGLLEGDV